MKMENVIKSPGEGIIKEIKVIKNSAIEKGSIMIEME
jgi:biotin carboxyl carrier protein